jgi:hypothetical protein
MSIRRELEAGTESARIAPWHGCAHRDRFHPRQFPDPPERLLIETHHLLGRAPLIHHRYVDRQYVTRVETGLSRLQREQRFDQRGGPRVSSTKEAAICVIAMPAAGGWRCP